LLDIDLSSVYVKTACFNDIFDGTEPPYEGVDLYIRFSNDIRVYVYGSEPKERQKELDEHEYVLIILADSLNNQQTDERIGIYISCNKHSNYTARRKS
jgi:hypothetical protein